MDVIIQAVSAPLMVEASTRPGWVRGAGAGAGAAAAGAGATGAGAAGTAAGAEASLAGAVGAAGAGGADAGALATGIGVEATLTPVWAPACWKTSPIQKHIPIAMDRLIAIQHAPFFRNQPTIGNNRHKSCQRLKAGAHALIRVPPAQADRGGQAREPGGPYR